MASIKRELAKGVFWIAIAKYSGIVIQILITAILARLISPSAFGTIAVAMVILHFLNILYDIGIGPAIVQYKQLNKSHLNSLFTLNFYIGLFLATILYFLSDSLSIYYSNQDLKTICQIMTIIVFFNSLNVVPNALMRKDKRFRTIALRTLFFQIFSGVIAVWCAFEGWGIYTLLVTPIVTAIGVFVVNYFNYPQKLVVKINSESINMVGTFSVFQFAFTFFNYFSRNLDKLIIGKFFSLTQLGYYDKSYHLMMLPLQNVSFVIGPVLHPVISTLQDEKKELSEKCRKLAVFISNISFPIGLLLFFCSNEIIKIVYGSQWNAAIPVFKILALSLPLQMIMSCSGPFYQTVKKTNLMFLSGMFNTICTVSSFIIAAYWGKTIESMAIAWDISLFINFVNSYFIMHYGAFRLSPMPFYRALLPQILNSVAVFLLLYLFERIFNFSNIIVALMTKSFIIFSLTIVFSSLLGQYKLDNIIKNLIITRNPTF